MAVAGAGNGQFAFVVFLSCCFLGTRYLVSCSGYGVADVALFSSFFLLAEDTPRYDFLVHGGVAGGICDVLC